MTPTRTNLRRLHSPPGALCAISTTIGQRCILTLSLSLSEAARWAMQAMDPRKYEYQSEFARRYVAQGRAEGEAKGRAALIIRLLAMRFGPLPQQVETRVTEASVEKLDEIGERLLTAQTLAEAIASQ